MPSGDSGAARARITWRINSLPGALLDRVQATARLAEAYLMIETIKTQIKAIDYDLDNMVDHKWQAVEEDHDYEDSL